MEEDDNFSSSIAWEQPQQITNTTNNEAESITNYNNSINSKKLLNSNQDSIVSNSNNLPTNTLNKTNKINSIKVLEPNTELEQTKDQFVSYLITAKVNPIPLPPIFTLFL